MGQGAGQAGVCTRRGGEFRGELWTTALKKSRKVKKVRNITHQMMSEKIDASTCTGPYAWTIKTGAIKQNSPLACA